VCSNALIMDLNQIVSEHQPIVEAIIDGHADLAETRAREHNAPEVARAAAAMAQEQAERTTEPSPPKRKARPPARARKAA
jgi:DNA-binding FadR family transcriptional regulator